MGIKNKNQRVSEDMLNEFVDIQRIRVNQRLDNPARPISVPRITSAIVKEPEWKSLKIKLCSLPRNPLFDKKGRRK